MNSQVSLNGVLHYFNNTSELSHISVLVYVICPVYGLPVMNVKRSGESTDKHACTPNELVNRQAG